MKKEKFLIEKGKSRMKKEKNGLEKGKARRV